MKNLNGKFVKNLYQIISCAISYLFIEILFLIALIMGLQNQESQLVFLMIMIGFMVGLPLITLIFGFYFIFQIVYFDDNGLKICIFKHIIREISWKDVKKIEYSSWMKNPTISIYLENGVRINFDRRKKIVSIINSHVNN